MKTDIQNIQDIKIILDSFYAKVSKDELIGVYFNKYFQIIWESHLEKMALFWDNILFYSGEYNGNPLLFHQKIHDQYKLSLEHFNRWLEIFYETIDELFNGEKANLMKEKAKSIGLLLLDNFD